MTVLRPVEPSFPRLTTVLCPILWMATSQVAAGDWPQWRGPSSCGISQDSGLPTAWSADRNIAWRVQLSGLGVSSPVGWGGRLFVTSQVGTTPVRGGSHPRLSREDPSLVVHEKAIGGVETPSADVVLVVEAFDLAAGEKVWEYRVVAEGEFPDLHEKHNLATPTPVTDGEHVYAWFGNGQVIALNDDGELVWMRHLGRDYSPFSNQWGHGTSPVLYGDLLLLLVDHRPSSYLLALDKKSGSERWKVDRGSGRVSHSTPLVVPEASSEELVVNSSERIDAYDPGTGDLLWWAGTSRQTPIPTPVFSDGAVYLSRGYRNSDFLAIRPGGRGDVTESHILWRSPRGASYVPSVLFYRGLLYMTNEVGVVTCADAASGEGIWRERLEGIFSASPIAGDGKVYFVSETGATFVLRAGRTPQLLAQNELGERFLASPAVVDGRLLLRSDSALFCIRE